MYMYSKFPAASVADTLQTFRSTDDNVGLRRNVKVPVTVGKHAGPLAAGRQVLENLP